MGRAFEYRRAAKEKRWANMSRIFPKLAKAITVAAKIGGPDKDLNPTLRTAIMNAKAQNMPKDNIDAAIKRASGKEANDLIEITYEGKGPGGVLFYVECLTNNTTRTIANIKMIFSKSGGQVVNSGSLEFMFSRKAVFEFAKGTLDLDALELELIDAGLEEIEVDENTVYAYADYKDFNAMSKALEQQGIAVENASLARVANTPAEFEPDILEQNERLIEKLEDDEDVQQVFTNIA